MSQESPSKGTATPSRRTFLKKASLSLAGASAASSLALPRSVHAAGSDVIRIALVGCGGRGRGAAINALSNTAAPNVKLVAVADAFRKNIDVSLPAIEKRCPGKLDVPEERKFVGLDAYQKAIDCGVDMLLFCTPPGFRPDHFEAAVKADKHVFLEKPVAVDGPGIRRIQATNKIAKKKGLLVAVGHHLRHETKHREVIDEIHDGAIGELQFLRAYFNSAGVWTRPRAEGETEMQHQVNNWYYFNWLSGDHIVEQHVHDLDVMNWIAGAHPVEANGMGGRQVRISPDHGEIFDHHAVEFTYANGLKMFSYCRHIPACWNSFSEHAHGTKGSVDIQGHGRSTLMVNGKEPVVRERGADGHQVEHDDLFAAMLAGQSYNEADHGAEATMTAIMGRMATYSGKTVSWDDAISSDLDLSPSGNTWDATPQSKPGDDGIYPCAMPGITKAL